MRDPLTDEEHDIFFENFKRVYDETYQKALNSGAVEDLQKHDHTLARCILQIAAEKFEPLNRNGKEMLRNLRKFV